MPAEHHLPFTLRQLAYFREVARRLHFRRAAEALAIAQPALSRAVAQLESDLGADLLRRTRRGVELTPAGRLLLERSEPLLRGLAALPADLRALAGGQVGHLRVGFTGLAMATVLPGLLRGFHAAHPGIRLELTEMPTSAQLTALLAGELACGFFHPDAPSPGIETRLLLRERNGILLSAADPIARRRTLRLQELAETPFVLFPRQHNPGFYDRILASFAAAGVSPKITEEVWPRANGIGLVRAGLGATFMTPSESRHLPPEVVCRRLLGPAPESRLVLGWKPTPDLEPTLASFLAVAARRPADQQAPSAAALP